MEKDAQTEEINKAGYAVMTAQAELARECREQCRRPRADWRVVRKLTMACEKASHDFERAVDAADKRKGKT